MPLSEANHSRDELRKHRRSLLAISSVVIVYQLGWISISDNVPTIGGLKIAADYAGWVLCAMFLYFFVLYHQMSWPFRIRAGLIEAATDRINRSLDRVAQRKAHRVARPEEEKVMLRKPMKPPDWPIAPKKWEFVFELSPELNSPDKREVSVVVENRFYVRSIGAWLYSLITYPTIIEKVFPSLWAGFAVLLAIPRIGACVRGLLGS